MSGKVGTLIAYATKPGSVADDNRQGQNGLYTAALLESLAEPGLTVPEVFNRTAGRVGTWSDDTQAPWTNQSYVPEVYLTPGDPVSDGGLRLGAYSTAELVDRAQQAARRGDYTTAAELLRETASRDHPASNTALGDLLLDGQGVATDWAGAVRFYRRAAELGDAEGQRKLADCLARGIGTEPDGADAARLYERAIAAGQNAAHRALGRLYAEGAPGLAPDLARAEHHLRTALQQSGTSSDGALPFDLAMLLRERGESDAEVLSLLQRAAAEGNVEALWQIGQAHEESTGAETDPAEAARWYRRGADGGDRAAAYRLGRLYEEGRGVSRDLAEAARLYDRALWIPDARLALAQMVEDGRGIPVDLDRAAALYAEGVRLGDEEAARRLAQLPRPSSENETADG